MSLTEFQLSEGRYNARDVLAMCRIYKPLAQALARHNVVNVYAIDREMAKLALSMHRVGLPIDAEERLRVGNHLKEIRDSGLAVLREWTNHPDFFDHMASFQAVKSRKADDEKLSQPELFNSAESAYAQRIVWRKEELVKEWNKERLKGRDPVNFGSKYQQAAILKTAGVSLVKVSPKSGIPTIDKDVLQGLLPNPAAKALLDYQLTATVIETFVDGLEVASDGFIHPNWLIHKITGRWGSNPNVQNWSVRAGGGAENLRRMVRAPRGFAFVGADFAQLEARILACLSRDQTLIEIFAQGRDIHAEMAYVGYPEVWPALDKIYKEHNPDANAKPCKCDKCVARKKLRDMVKRLEYGAFYGGDPRTLHAAVVKDVPALMLRDVEKFVRAINTRMPSLLRWRHQTLLDATREFEIRSPFLGRRQTFPLGRVDPNVAFNYKAQSGGADLWALGALDFLKVFPLDKPGLPRIIHNGHDSILVLCRESEADEVKHVVESSWQRTVAGVPFLIEAKIGERWSEV